MTGRMGEILDGLQARLLGDLAASRSALKHPGARGTASEDAWLALLKDHLPFRYQAERGFVIDHTGASSDAIDIIIFDRQYTPLVYNLTGQIFVPAEGVYAIVEVKQDLTAQHVQYAGQKAASVRRLARTSAPIPHAGGTFEPRPLHQILAGIITHHSSWSPPLGQSLIEALGLLTEPEYLDIGCALQDGTFVVDYTGSGTASMSAYEGSRSLVHFLWRLLMKLQRLATVPAIDFERYLLNL